MIKFGWYVIFLAYFLYFKQFFIFRGPTNELFQLFSSIWQPWKWNLTSYHCSGSLKTHESEFCFSGFPKFGYQGCHISLGQNYPNSISAHDDGQITNLEHHTVGILGKFCWPFSILDWTVRRRSQVRDFPTANLLLVSVARVSTLFLRGCEMAEGRTSSIFCSHLRVMFTFLLSSNWYLFCSYCYSSGTVTSDKSIIIMTKSGLFEWKSEITRVLEIPWTDTKKTLSGPAHQFPCYILTGWSDFCATR